METTRHFTATTYVVADGATALHRHDRIGKWLPPGGHVDRDELPHRAAVREVREEIGQEVTLLAQRDDDLRSDTTRPLPKPHHVQLADVNRYDDRVGHQHVDLIYYAAAEERAIDPLDDEQGADDWSWFDRESLSNDEVASDVAEIGRRAIETVETWREQGDE